MGESGLHKVFKWKVQAM